MSSTLLFICFLIVVYFIIRLLFRDQQIIYRHWHHTFDNFSYSPQDFYDGILKNIENRKMPEVKTSYIEYSEKKLFGYNRRYFRVELDNYVFDICAAPFGTAFFVSYWFVERRSFINRMLRKIEMIAKFLDWATYYQIDTRITFGDCVETEVFFAVDTMTTAKGITALSKEERIPIISENTPNRPALKPR